MADINGEHLLYDGQNLHWKSPKDGKPEAKYPATSGMPGAQNKRHTCAPDKGPVPEGLYVMRTWIDDKPAQADGSGTCTLKPSWRIQTIPRGAAAGACERYWANWGDHRVRIEPANTATRTACTPHRGGFHLHDSTKGYSHGCIEVDTKFFDRLLDCNKHTSGSTIHVKVEYAFAKTNGGTKKP
ncbi:hypothetical protein [uncultured Rhodospira sp.]|uniref:hypothetical protein n=1 Tax=uncultured Rhodospira sp. TaxID=1936189 RepID=UPI0026297BE8|nr:hypothetical protein [uncultured Rhodospira sp.]